MWYHCRLTINCYCKVTEFSDLQRANTGLFILQQIKKVMTVLLEYSLVLDWGLFFWKLTTALATSIVITSAYHLLPVYIHQLHYSFTTAQHLRKQFGTSSVIVSSGSLATPTFLRVDNNWCVLWMTYMMLRWASLCSRHVPYSSVGA